MSANGVIVGGVSEAENEWKPAKWVGDEVEVLDIPQGFVRGSVSHIIGEDVLLGSVWNDDYGFDSQVAMWTDGVVHLLPHSQMSFVQGVNSLGEVIAMSYGTSPPTCLYLHDGEWVNIASLLDVPSQFLLTDVVGIDETGRILAQGVRNYGELDAEWGLFRLVPVPSPGVVGVGAVCFAAMGCTRRRDPA